MVEWKRAQKIKKIIPKTNGIFGHMNYTFIEGVTKPNLDIQFVANWGLRNPSPIVETVQTEYGEQLSDADLTLLASLILEMYKDRWDKLAQIYSIEYDPIHNYLDEWEDTSDETVDRDVAMGKTGYTAYGHTEGLNATRIDTLNTTNSVDEDKSRTRTDNLESEVTRDTTDTERRTDALKEETTYGRSDSRTDNLTEGVQQSTSGSTQDANDNSVVAFNQTTSSLTDEASSSGSHNESLTATTQNTGTQTNASSGKDTVDNTGTRTTVTEGDGTVTTENTGTQTIVDDNSIVTTQTGTVTRGTQSTTTHGGRDDTVSNGTESEDIQRDRDRSGTHSGNIGNITSQKMIAEEIALWKWKYVQEILSDVKEFCTLPVYLNATEWSLQEVEEEET